MKKKNKTMERLTSEQKVSHFRLRKAKKFWLVSGSLLTITLGSGGLVFATQQSNASLPASTTVNWDLATSIGHVTLSTGEADSMTLLTLGDGTPVYCLSPGVPLATASTSAEQDETNAIWSQLTDSQQAIINNIAYLANKQGAGSKNMELYWGARLAIWAELDKWGAISTSVVGFGDLNAGFSSHQIVAYQNQLTTQAVQLGEQPSFSGSTVSLIQGVSKTVTDSNSVLSNFPYVQSNVSGLSETVSGNNLKLNADITSALGVNKNAITFANMGLGASDRPFFIYSTNGDSSGEVSQPVIASQDPAVNSAALNVNIIGLGETTLTKADADTNSSTPQGEASLSGAVYQLFNKNGSAVKWSDGQDGYPITATAGTKADDTAVVLKMGSDLQLGVKNLVNDQAYYWQEMTAPEGYSLSTKHYAVSFDASSSFDNSTSNYEDKETASDQVAVFSFMFDKVQDVNGSLTGLNGAEFTLTPQTGTKGKALVVTSGTGTDSNGYTVNGLTTFDGAANHAAGNADQDGIPIGDYLLTETTTPDGVSPINPISITSTPNQDSNGNPTSYTVVFKDKGTGQLITTQTIQAKTLTDNDLMFKVNLGSLTDKPVTPVVPTIQTKAHTADGDQTVEANEVSTKTPMYDQVTLTNATKGEEQVAQLHRIVTDDSGKTTSDKVVATVNFTVDDATVKSQENEVQTKVDTSKDNQVSEGSSVTYVWTESLFDAGANTKTATPVAKHDALTDKAETISSPTGHTQVSTNAIEAKTNQKLTDTYQATGLTVGQSYTVKVTGAWDQQKGKVVPATGSLTFKATSTSMTVKVPITVNATGLGGDDLTMLEDLVDATGRLIVSNQSHTDQKETFHVTPSTPLQKILNIYLPKTGENLTLTNILACIGTALVGAGLVFLLRKNIHRAWRFLQYRFRK